MSSLVLILLLAAAATACVSALIFALQRPRTNRSNNARRGQSSGHAKAAPHPAPAPTPGATHRLSAAERDEMLDGVKNLAENDPEKVAGLIRSWISEDEPPRR